MSLPETMAKIFEKSIDMIDDEYCEFPEEDFNNLIKDSFKVILKETSKFIQTGNKNENEMDLQKRIDELEAENKALKEQVVKLEKQVTFHLLNNFCKLD